MAKNEYIQALEDLNNTSDTTAEYEQEDIAKNKVFAILSYIAILWVVPLLAAPNSKFAKFHANQGLVLFIVEVIWGVASAIVNLVLGWIPVVGAVIGLVMWLLGLVLLAPMVIGIINAANGKAKELPFIGKIQILK